jgi:hypothetical protein
VMVPGPSRCLGPQRGGVLHDRCGSMVESCYERLVAA